MSLTRRFQHAFRGLALALRAPEHALHLVIVVFVVAAGIVFCLDLRDWVLVVIAIGLVLTAETMNTAFEGFLDAASGVRTPVIRRAKDLSAAVVLQAALTAVAIGLAVFLPTALSGAVGHCLV